jgi:hypothetical protein
MIDAYRDIVRLMHDIPRMPWECYRKLRPVLLRNPWVPEGQFFFMAKGDMIPEHTVVVHHNFYKALRAITGQDQFPPTDTELACILLHLGDEISRKDNKKTIRETFAL